MNPKVSVIVPVYNVEDYLERCLDSIINQTYRNLEIILVNDGSTDNCGAICEEYAKKDNRIIVIHKENGGQSTARNTGMDICTGEYIAFVDSDDYIHPETYNSCVYVMQKEDVDFVEFEFKKVYENDPFDDVTDYSYEIHNVKEVIEGRIRWKKHYCLAWNKLFKKIFIINLRFPKGLLHEDSMLFNIYVFQINKVGYIPLKFYYYFQREGSTMNSIFKIENTTSLKNRVEFYKLLKTTHNDLSQLQLKVINKHFHLDINRASFNKNDIDYKIRFKLISILLSVYKDLINSDILDRNQKNSIVLANENPLRFLEKCEKGIVRK